MKKYYAFLAVVFINIILYFIKDELVKLSLKNSLNFFLEVLKIFPPVMILMGLLDAWISKGTIEAHLGVESGLKGSLLAILLGSAAAGPLFAAFPIAIGLRHKGARIANIVIFLGSWATIKIPMILIESNFINLRFSLLRLLVTVPFIFCIGYIMEKLLKNEEFLAE